MPLRFGQALQTHYPVGRTDTACRLHLLLWLHSSTMNCRSSVKLLRSSKKLPVRVPVATLHIFQALAWRSYCAAAWLLR